MISKSSYSMVVRRISQTKHTGSSLRVLHMSAIRPGWLGHFCCCKRPSQGTNLASFRMGFKTWLQNHEPLLKGDTSVIGPSLPLAEDNADRLRLTQRFGMVRGGRSNIFSTVNSNWDLIRVLLLLLYFIKGGGRDCNPPTASPSAADVVSQPPSTSDPR